MTSKPTGLILTSQTRSLIPVCSIYHISESKTLLLLWRLTYKAASSPQTFSALTAPRKLKGWQKQINGRSDHTSVSSDKFILFPTYLMSSLMSHTLQAAFTLNLSSKPDSRTAAAAFRRDSHHRTYCVTSSRVVNCGCVGVRLQGDMTSCCSVRPTVAI